MATEETRHLKHAALGRGIDSVEARLLQRRADVKRRAAAVGDQLSEAMTSPFMLIGAAGIGAAVAWYYPRRKTEPATEEGGASMLGTITSGLHLAGIVLSLFPSGSFAPSQQEETDPR